MANIVWQPQPRQAVFLQRPEYEALYGGAAGGGKSDALLAEALRQVHIPHYRALILRKTYPQLTELIDRSHAIYAPAFPGAVYNESKHFWRFPSGAKIYFGAMQHTSDRTNYQGKRYDFIGFDELTHFTWEEYSYMFSRNRPSPAPGDHEKTRVYIRATTNPGGIGHGWVKERFLSVPPMTTVTETFSVKTPEGVKEYTRDRVYINSTIFDNSRLLEENPEYLGSLAMLPEKERNALLYGDWDCFTGQYFGEFRVSPDVAAARAAGCTDSEETLKKTGRWCHVIPQFDLNSGSRRNWTILRSYDFGYAKPFSCGWWAVDFDGRLYRILELYGCTENPNEGVRWTPDAQFRRIAELERTHPWLKGRNIQGVADPAIWDASRGESIADTAMRYGVYFSKGDHDRIPGWMQCRYRLQFDGNGYPGMYVFDSCKAFLRTVPLMRHDATRPEDLDSTLEDHVCDEWRYLCMSRPIAPINPTPKEIPMKNPLKV